MAYGQPFWNYGANNYGAYNGGYVAPQPQPNYLYNQQPNMTQNAQNQPLSGYPQQQGQMTQQQQVQPTQPTMQTQQPMANNAPIPQGFPIRELRFVTSEEAKAYIVMPNSNALLLDTVNGMAYLKTADYLGQSVTEYFKFNKVNADGSPIQNASEQPTTQVHEEVKAEPIDTKDFLKKDDIKGFITVDEFKSLSDQVKNLQNKLNAKQAKSDKGKEIDNAE